MLKTGLKWTVRSIGVVVVLAASLYGAFLFSACSSMGAAAEGDRLKRMEASKQWRGEAFGNELEAVPSGIWEIAKKRFAGTESAEPEKAIAIEKRTGTDYETPPASGLRVTWLGHSTLLIEIDERRILFDPVWGERTSPVTWVGPKRFHAPPLPLAQLPNVDAIVISHDHYDHLDYETVTQLLDLDTKWIVPLGIGAHLEHWGIAPSRIVELDWWEEATVANLTLTCTPARHFSGRSPTFSDRNATLWAGWAVVGPQHRVFYSGDTSLHPEFKTIGEKLGPFDLTMLETGASDALWRDVHLGPEQAVIAHQLLGGKLMLPVHWGTFNLGNHAWTQPIQRVLAAAKDVGVEVVAPRPGGRFEPADGPHVDSWWDPDATWKTRQQSTTWSTSVEELLKDSPLYVGSKGGPGGPQ